MPGRLPLRALSISNQNSHVHMQLHTSVDEERGDYTALSYCWGGPQELQLVRENLNSFHDKGLDSSILP
jgi:hypothetical protein